MPVRIEQRGRDLFVQVLHPRIDGENIILRALQEGNYFMGDYGVVEIDLGLVEYLNSLGITEFVNIHRQYSSRSDGKTKLRFLNVERKVNAIFDLVELHKIAEIKLKED